jgi:hypothetical protein
VLYDAIPVVVDPNVKVCVGAADPIPILVPLSYIKLGDIVD